VAEEQSPQMAATSPTLWGLTQGNRVPGVQSIGVITDPGRLQSTKRHGMIANRDDVFDDVFEYYEREEK